MLRQTRPALLLILAVLGVFAGVVAADGSYEITVENGEIDVPEREVSVAGQDITVTSVAPIEQGEALDISTSTTQDSPYDVILYNSDMNFEAFEPGLSGDESITFQTGGLAPGTYGVVIDTGEVETVQPVVIEAYQMSLSAPSEVNRSENASADISLDETNPEPEVVEVVLANNTVNKRVSAERTAEGEYTAAIPTEYEPGEYRLYAAARNETGGSGLTDAEILSLSDEYTLTITESERETDEQDGEDETDEQNDGQTGGSENTGDDTNSGGTTGGGSGGSDGGTSGGVPPTSDSDTETQDGTPTSGSNGSQQATVQIQPDVNSNGSYASFGNTSTVESVSFSSNVNGTVEVTTRSGVPADVMSPPGETIYVSEITVPEHARDVRSTIRVVVSTDRLSERNTTAENLRVSRFSNGRWAQLDTTVANETAQTVVLDAETPGFSMFAVTADRGQTSDNAENGSATDDGGTDDEGETDGSSNDTDDDTGGTEDGSGETDENSSGGEADNNTIDPIDNTSDTGPDSTNDSTPGFGILTGLIAVTLLLVRARR
ncbi:PGF-pre-PGF domain-containing protein [Halorubrum ezzemoulense]|uniref:PGF-pre-PGF domain-containing protein n=1 Tax=Halorubrum ezzemoulense TaxID=337243 RepID=UPI00232E1C23|nr:PGF-pre-PGF domain-containing protein [Halorubrum ezzemoulense]MDB9235644.1 PGF-pre-PGF domain-containing protein [Halorubrum ezzemoulense]MDB9253015.1 PGF-pre-PGF domain-containing protein [Halorubrum ezzemoulense]MDB9255272.1 PGF-pre-PGF domain-containing protein [Halorubrum ezzemoulense]MDB9275983.1 PGF-pre-PGF domain-containing protein [Halorubrum ezzemoulense]